MESITFIDEKSIEKARTRKTSSLFFLGTQK